MTGAGQPGPSVHLRSGQVLEHSGTSGQTPESPPSATPWSLVVRWARAGLAVPREARAAAPERSGEFRFPSCPAVLRASEPAHRPSRGCWTNRPGHHGGQRWSRWFLSCTSALEVPLSCGKWCNQPKSGEPPKLSGPLLLHAGDSLVPLAVHTGRGLWTLTVLRAPRAGF